MEGFKMKAKTVTGYEPRFDIDLKRGKVGEDKTLGIIDAINESRIEVKTDYGVWKTGNLYIEYEKQNRQGDWVPSGIASTEADYWAFAFKDGAIFVETSRLRELVAKHLAAKNIGYRPGNAHSSGSRGIKLPLNDLAATLTSYGDEREKDATQK
jgi:hypothetical protein